MQMQASNLEVQNSSPYHDSWFWLSIEPLKRTSLKSSKQTKQMKWSEDCEEVARNEKEMCETSSSEEIKSVSLDSTFHEFFCWSQLSKESKGGYLTGNIAVPHHVKKIELALYNKSGSPNPCLLFLTPYNKMFGEKPTDIKGSYPW